MMKPIDESCRCDFEWKAQWIWKSGKTGRNEFAYFRKEYNLVKKPAHALAYVSAHNHFELFINGEKVSGYVVPAHTHPEKSKYYLCYDIGDLLRCGMNAVCASAHYIGGGGQNYVDGLPGFILQCSIAYDDNTEDTFITDETWKVLGDTPFKNGTEFQQNRRISAVEDYDARKQREGWLFSGFDDSLWQQAGKSPIHGKGWILKPQRIPEGKIYEIITPEAAGIQKNGLQVFDAGEIITGWPRVELPGIRDVQVRMRYSEDMQEGRVKHNVANEASETYYDQYTMKGEERESWEPCYSYKAFRYVEVTGYPEMLRPENVKIVSAGTGLTYSGYFDSSNPLLNDIYKACIQTQKNSVVGQMTDSPHREQAQYLADSDLQAETFIYNFSESAVLEKVLTDFTDAQNDDGSMPFVFPTNVDNKDFNIKIPEWDLHYITLLWKIYMHYGDVGMLERCYNTAYRIIKLYLGKIDKAAGLVPKAEGFPTGWNISDWPYPNIDDSGGFLTVGNCFFYHDLCLMEKIASAIGYDRDIPYFDQNASKLKDSIIKHLYNPESGCFMDCSGSSRYSQGTNVVAYQYGLVPEKARDGLLAYIVSMGFGCSTLLTLNLLQVLFENGRGQTAFDLINRTEQPGWGHMIAKGYKTIWEGFQDKESHSHAWNAYPARIFMEYLAGVKPAAPGFKEIVFKPFIPSGMEFAEAKVPSIRGEIFAGWENTGGGMSYKLSVPDGTQGHVFIPKLQCGGKTIHESGAAIWEAGVFKSGSSAVEYLGEDAAHVKFKVGPGQYLFRVGEDQGRS